MLEQGPKITHRHRYRLAGTVKDASQNPMERKVIAVPRSHPEWYVTVSDPMTGEWSINNIPSLKYRVFVIDHTKEFQPWAADYIKPVPMD
ncbi:carboxypeptidase-like regulatory domain-containing protein [Thioalkalivibrio sp. ALJ8]|uniref:carboxypeptidase-like regulatory domain-containing protein n=1 Tax=Thioalkalivibrio sp. ALJ8 TaxID=1158757 RepID=UPI0012DD39E4|nr:carboxypeptidase-like regulatory domain-containing protein [Thioalkalivibrio sp. ALJ8]